MGLFRTGSLKLLFLNRIDMLPVTIDGTYKCFEKYGNVRSTRIKIIIHPVLSSSDFETGDFEKFNSELRKIIASPLEMQV
jgi:hypothetical protein